MFNYTFLCYFSLKNEHFFWHKGKNIIVLNLWYICFALYKGDLISDFEKFLDEVEKETKRNDLTFVDLVLDKNRSNNILFKYTFIICLSSLLGKFYQMCRKAPCFSTGDIRHVRLQLLTQIRRTILFCIFICYHITINNNKGGETNENLLL